jgi:subtilisin family serine protease
MLVQCGEKDSSKPRPVPTDIAYLSGDGQTGAAGSLLPQPIVAVVTDANGDPVSGVTVTMATTPGDGTLSVAQPKTDPQGRVAAQWTLGAHAGAQNASATVSGLTGSPVTFGATATTTGTLNLISGDGQIGADGTLLLPLVVEVRDNSNVGQQGVTVTWQVTSGGGVLDATTTTTDQNGQAKVNWTMGPGPGTQTVQAASAATNPGTVDFSATTVVAAPSSISGTVATVNFPIAPPASLRVPASVRAGGMTEGVRPLQRNRLVSAGGIEYTPDELIVHFKPAAIAAPGFRAMRALGTARSVAATMRGRLLQHLVSGRVRLDGVSPVISTARIRVANPAKLDSVRAELLKNPAVAGVSRGRWMRTDDISPALREPVLTPNDPNYPNQSWHYTMIGLPEAWAITTGSSNIIVAVVDNGIRFDHPALTANLRNDGYDFVSQTTANFCAGGTTSNTGDGNGYDSDPTIPVDYDVLGSGCLGAKAQFGGHGIHTSGTIGAVGNDGVSVLGVNWHVSIRPVRVLGLTGGSDYDVAQGILYAAGLPAGNEQGDSAVIAPPAQGARIINVSLGGGCSLGTNPAPGLDVLHDAVMAATDPGLPNGGSLIVASAGNSGSSVPNCPAAYPEVLSVSAVGPQGTLASYSNFGPTIDIAAPGGDIDASPLYGGAHDGTWGVFSTVCNFQSTPCTPDEARYEGTSMAAPHVSGVAALILADNPALTAAQLRSRLLTYAVPAGPANSYGAGIVNARNSLLQNMGPNRQLFVRLYDATTLNPVATMPASGGAYNFTGLADGSYFVFAGEDEDGDGLLGVLGRRWGAYGGAGAPRSVAVSSTTGAYASFQIGSPLEHEDDGSIASASLLVDGTYQTGTISSVESDFFQVRIQTAGVHTFETSGFNGAYCAFGMELNTILQLYNSAGNAIGAPAVDIDPSPTANKYCSRETVNLAAGIYYARITPDTTLATNIPDQGRYRLEVRQGP